MLDLTETHSWQLSLGVPGGRQGPNYLDHHLLPPRVYTSREVELVLELGLESLHSIGDAHAPSDVSIAAPNACPISIF